MTTTPSRPQLSPLVSSAITRRGHAPYAQDAMAVNTLAQARDVISAQSDIIAQLAAKSTAPAGECEAFLVVGRGPVNAPASRPPASSGPQPAASKPVSNQVAAVDARLAEMQATDAAQLAEAEACLSEYQKHPPGTRARQEYFAANTDRIFAARDFLSRRGKLQKV